MAKTNNLTEFLTGLADKFRAKLGGTALINPQSFESKIDEVYQKGYDDAPKGTDTSDATATAADVLQGKIFYGADGVSQKGTIVEQSSLFMNYSSWVPGQMPRVGFKPAANGYVTTDYLLMVLGPNLANGIELTADKILKGKNVLYLDGTATSDATATAADILSGKTAYVNGVKLTGTAQTGVDVSDTTATAADVVSSKVFYGADGTKQTGEVYVMDMLAGRITNDGGTISGGSVTDSNGAIGFYSDPYGFPLYLKGTGGFSVEAPYSVVAQAIGLTGDKIVSGNTVLGVAGTAATGGGSETGLLEASTLQNTGIVISNPVLPKRLLLMMITDGFYDFGKTTTYALAAGLVDFETNAATLFGITSGLGVFTTTASDFATVSGNTITFSVPADVDLCFLADKTYFYSVEY